MDGGALMDGDDGAFMSGGVGLSMDVVFVNGGGGSLMSGDLIPNPLRYIFGHLNSYILTNKN